jgi:peptide-methionine (R)-S-oxide reductase
MKQQSNDFWKEKLDSEQYRILREKGTDAPFTGKYVNNFENGMYECAACGHELFSSDTKFHSDCGWPSFDRSIEGNIKLVNDYTHGMERVEVLCNNCESHLGHIFDDGPQNTTGKRFCINSTSLSFKKS